MTDYCTQQDMVDRYGERELVALTDEDGQGVIDAAVLARAIADASATIDGYLAGRYTLPLPVVPVVLTRVCCDIARYYLYEDVAPEQIEKRYEEAVALLTKVGEGKLSLGLDAGGSPPDAGDGAEMTSGGRVFSRDDESFI